jgi:hypothetical protein
MSAASSLSRINLADQSWRRAASRRIQQICAAPACLGLLDALGCDQVSGSLMIVDALRIAFRHGELYGVTGFPLSPPFSSIRWLNAVLRIGPNVYADAAGIGSDRQVKNRWLRHTPLTITVAIAPAPLREAWAEQLPGVVYDQATVERLAELFG